MRELQQAQESADAGTHADASDVLIEAPHGYGTRLLLRHGSALEQADGLLYVQRDVQRAGASSAMTRWTIALGGLALFPLCGGQGALLVQAQHGESEQSALAVFRIIQDARTDNQPWRDVSEPGWRVLRPPERAQVGRPSACEIIGATFAPSHPVEPGDDFVLRARSSVSVAPNWCLEWARIDQPARPLLLSTDGSQFAPSSQPAA